MESLKKVILFIVEGDSDKVFFDPVLNELFPNEEYKFAVVKGDITGDYEVTTVQNIDNKLKTIIKEYKDEKKIYDSDIKKIVHIIDTDGAFIDDKYIEFHQSDEILYTNSKIRTNHVDKVIKKNILKKAVVNKLIHTKTIKNIPYEIYFMSCNLDHVLFDEPNQKDYEKKKKALEYADSLFGKETEFLELLESNVIKHYTDYSNSWEDIYNGKNSLRRASNFNCYLNQNLKK
jgi:hypothetical protein